MIIKILFSSALSLRCHWPPIFDFTSFSSWPILSSWPQLFLQLGCFWLRLYDYSHTCYINLCRLQEVYYPTNDTTQTEEEEEEEEEKEQEKEAVRKEKFIVFESSLLKL